MLLTESSVSRTQRLDRVRTQPLRQTGNNVYITDLSYLTFLIERLLTWSANWTGSAAWCPIWQENHLSRLLYSLLATVGFGGCVSDHVRWKVVLPAVHCGGFVTCIHNQLTWLSVCFYVEKHRNEEANSTLFPISWEAFCYIPALRQAQMINNNLFPAVMKVCVVA